MKFRNLETGEIFNTIFVARGKFCYGKWCADCLLPSTIKPELLPDDSGGCYEFCMKHPIEAAHLMGYEVIPEPGDDTVSLDTVVEAFNQIGKEANMDKPRICEVLGVEVGEVWTFGDDPTKFRINKDGHREYYHCDKWQDGCAEFNLCDVINNPDRIIRKPHFTEQEVEDAKMVKAVFGENGIVMRLITEEYPYTKLFFNQTRINGNLFPSIKEGQEYLLDEIIESEAQP